MHKILGQRSSGITTIYFNSLYSAAHLQLSIQLTSISKMIQYTEHLVHMCAVCVLTIPGDQGCKLGGYTGMPLGFNGLLGNEDCSLYSSSWNYTQAKV